MINIDTIQDYMALSNEQRGDICRNIKTVERLKSYLSTLNTPSEPEDPKWVPCSKCETRGWVLHNEERRNNADIHASQIHKCIKSIWYSCTDHVHEGIPKVSPEGRLVFDHGHALHHVLQSYGKKGAWCAPINYQSEAAIIPSEVEAIAKKAHILPEAIKWHIRSSVDAVIWKYVVPNIRGLGDISIRLIHEYKSISPGRPTKDGGLYGGFAALRGPKLEHKQQATIYMRCFNIPICVFLYYNKGDDNIAEFPLPYDSITWSQTAGKIEKILAYVDNEIMPPWEYTAAVQDPRECLSCDYLEICKPPTKFEVK